ncbi:MAG: Tad domain-containing protein [Burkholderiaceae bacterium]|nr:Tad domain-containing protein [Burkholderiaceae bacterium]
MKKHAPLHGRRPQRGAVMLIFGLTLVVLIGFAGLAIDLGRFFVVKSELQNAMDACALSAASQLKPGANDSNALIRAAAYGKVFITGADAVRNKVNFQSKVPDPNILEITFATSNAGPYNDVDPNTAKFVKCNYPLTGLPIYFMQVLNLIGLGPFTTQTVSAMAVATRDAPTASCIPVAACSAAGGTPANNFGHSVGEWITAYDGVSYGTGNFGWIDFTPPAGGASEVKAILAGSMQCNIAQIGDHIGQNGNLDTLQEAWNSRFGWYRKGGAYSTAEAPPDMTGFAYSNLTKDGAPNAGNWPSGANAYSGTSSVPGQLNFIQARAVNKPYQVADDIPRGIKTVQYKDPLDATQLSTLGRVDRRIVAAPVVDCSVWNTPPGNQMPPILGWACVLMLNPIENGSTASLIAKLEFLGLASGASSACSGGAALAISPVLTQ